MTRLLKRLSLKLIRHFNGQTKWGIWDSHLLLLCILFWWTKDNAHYGGSLTRLDQYPVYEFLLCLQRYFLIRIRNLYLNYLGILLMEIVEVFWNNTFLHLALIHLNCAVPDVLFLDIAWWLIHQVLCLEWINPPIVVIPLLFSDFGVNKWWGWR